MSPFADFSTVSAFGDIFWLFAAMAWAVWMYRRRNNPWLWEYMGWGPPPWVRRAAALAEADAGYAVRYVRVVDGDTIKVEMPDMPGEIPIRLYGVDTPEKGEPGWTEARHFTDVMCSTAHDVRIRRTERGKWYPKRLVADVVADGQSVSEALVKAGLAREAYGGL